MERKHGSRENIPFNPLYLEIEKEESKNRFLFHFKPTDYSVTACASKLSASKFSLVHKYFEYFSRSNNSLVKG